jgi:hypothetical protein
LTSFSASPVSAPDRVSSGSSDSECTRLPAVKIRPVTGGQAQTECAHWRHRLADGFPTSNTSLEQLWLAGRSAASSNSTELGSPGWGEFNEYHGNQVVICEAVMFCCAGNTVRSVFAFVIRDMTQLSSLTEALGSRAAVPTTITVRRRQTCPQ